MKVLIWGVLPWCVALAVLGQSAQAVLVSYWPFEEGVDELGPITFDMAPDGVDANDGTLGFNVTRVPGIVGVSALSFDNSDDSSVDAGPGVNMSFDTSTGISLEALIVPTWSGDMLDYDEIFRKEDGSNRYLFSFQNDTNNGAAFPVVDPGPVLSFGLGVGDPAVYEELDMPLNVDLSALQDVDGLGSGGTPNSGTIYLDDPGTALGPNDVVLKDGGFHHVVATYDDSNGAKSIYVNGTLRWQTTVDFIGISSGGEGAATIGNVGPGGGEPFSGVIDEVAFYDSALTAQEVSDHYTNVTSGQGLNYFGELPPTPPDQPDPAPDLPDPGNIPNPPNGLVAFWDFDEAGAPSEDFSLNFAYDRVDDMDGRFHGTATRTAGLVGLGAAEFDNADGSTVDVGDGSDENAFSFTTGIAIEALIQPEWSGDVEDYDQIFRKDDGGNRILFSFQNDAFGGSALVPVDAGPALSLGLNIDETPDDELPGAYGELDMPLDVDLTTLDGGNPDSGTIYLEDPGTTLGPNDVVLKDGNAHHVLAQYDSESGQMGIYINGQLRWSVDRPADSLITSGGEADGHIGSSGGGGVFDGIIDELAIWSRPLTQQEIDDHVANVLAGMNYFASNSGVPGDFNGDNVVNLADYTVWRDSLGSSTPLSNDDGLGTPIGTAHYDLWKSSFGTTSGSLTAQQVPEPHAVVLGIMTVVIGLTCQVRRHATNNVKG